MLQRLGRLYFWIFPEVIMHNHTWAVRRFVRWVGASLPKQGRVLDAGAGDLQYRKFFAAQRYVSLDYTAAAGLDVIGSVAELPFCEGSFDAVLSFQVLEHVSEPRAFFQEAHRCLKPGGALYLSTHNAFPLHMEPYDFFRFTKYGLAALGEESGFAVERITPQGGIFLVIAKLLQLSIPELLRNQKLILAYYAVFSLPIFAVNLLCYLLDKLDRSKRITLNYECVFRRLAGGNP